MTLFKKYTINSCLSLLAMLFTLSSCDDTTDAIGSSVTDINNTVEFEAKVFNVATKSVAASDIVSRTRVGYIGKIKDEETKDYVTCNYMTQFRVLGQYQFPTIDSVYINLEKYNKDIEKYKQIEADSCALRLYIVGCEGDSLALMKVSAHEMSKPYEENETYTTEFDPEAHDMIRKDAGSVHSQVSYTIANKVFSDAQQSSSNFNNYISIALNDPYTDPKDNTTYNNYGTYLLRNFYNPEHKGSYYNTYKFAHDICPGFYIKHQGGLGNIAKVMVSDLLVYYKGIQKKDSVVNYASSFAGTEEVIQKTTISQDAQKLQSLISEETCTYLKTPAGIFTEVTIPVKEIMEGHENDTLNTARLFIPRINNKSTSGYTMSVPQTLLLIPTDSIQGFFENNKVANNRITYITTYSSDANGYTFGNISYLLSVIYNAKKTCEANGKPVPDNWNKVMIIPVEPTYTTVSGTSQALTKLTHDMTFASTKLKKGDFNSDNIRISVIYSKYK